MPRAIFRFYQELNDFLPPARRQAAFEHEWRGAPSIKHLIEALGVPHTEVDLILVDDRSVEWTYQPQEDNRVAVYPVLDHGYRALPGSDRPARDRRGETCTTAWLRREEL